MSNIDQKFNELRAEGESALIGYITAGLPSSEKTSLVAEALIRGGVDILELGLPFSDPIADGPTIQASSYKALKLGVTPKKVFNIVEEIKSKFNIPIVILTYYNPLYRIGVDKFFQNGKSQGLDGVVVPDLPLEESDHYVHSARKNNVDTIFLASPSTSIERLKKIIDVTSGFLYLVSVYGVTGARTNIKKSSLDLVKRFKPYTVGRTNLAVGFGISRPSHVQSVVEAGADGVIVGSALVKIIDESISDDIMLTRLTEFAKILKVKTQHVKN